MEDQSEVIRHLIQRLSDLLTRSNDDLVFNRLSTFDSSDDDGV